MPFPLADAFALRPAIVQNLPVAGKSRCNTQQKATEPNVPDVKSPTVQLSA